MSAIRILAETKDTVTISRQDWANLLAELEDIEDRAAVQARRAREATSGRTAERQDYLTGQEALRLLRGERAVRIWREKRGITQRALGTRAGVAPSYLAEIEAGRKPGSADALSRLARALGVPMDDLISEQQRRRLPDYGPVYLRSWPCSVGVAEGHRGAAPVEQRFGCVRDAWDVVSREWQTLRNQSPEITDEERLPIFSQEDLFREQEPHLFSQEAPRAVAFEADAKWSGRLGSFVLWAAVAGQRVRCRVTEEVFRDCLDEAATSRKDIPRLFARHRPTFERALRNAIHQNRFNIYQDAGQSRREVVVDPYNFHVLLNLSGQ